MSKIELDRNNKTLYGQIADILRERIMSGEFKPGDILPSERELAEEMQVSRIPVREAMKSLEYLGVVKQIRGKGVLVQHLEGCWSSRHHYHSANPAQSF